MIESKNALFKTNTLLGESTPAWQLDTDFIDLYIQVSSNTLLSSERLFVIYQYVKYSNFITGDFAQVGVLCGGSAKLIELLMAANKKLHLFDTFNGLPEPHPEFDLYDKGCFNAASEQQVRELFKGSEERVTINTGVFPSTATKEHRNTNYAFVYLDVDIYTSNIAALEFFYPKLSSGGVIIMDDYDWQNTPGIKRSALDFTIKHGLPEPIITTKYQALIQKIG